MTTCQQIEPWLVDALYEELDEGRRHEVEAHLQACAACAAEYRSLRATLEFLDQRETEELPDSYWPSFQSRMRAAVASLSRRHHHAVAWTWQAVAAVAILLVGVTLGRLSAPPPPLEWSTTPIPSSSQVADAMRPAGDDVAAPTPLGQWFGDYLDRTQTLLVGIVNLDPSADGFGAFDLGPHQALSARLAHEASLIERDLRGAGERRQARLVLELQDVLQKIAALEVPERPEGLQTVRKQVRDRALLFQIALERGRRNALGTGATGQAFDDPAGRI